MATFSKKSAVCFPEITFYFLIILVASSVIVSATSQKKIIAFFQGTCSSVVPNPCKQTCHDITGGGFICDCDEGWKLDKRNGRDCIVDPEYKAPVPVSQPVELTNHGYVIRNNDDGADGTANLSEQKGEKIPPSGSKGADNLRLSGRQPPTPVEVGGDNDIDDFSIHSIDVKAGLQPPQGLYRVAEGGEDEPDDEGELSSNAVDDNGPALLKLDETSRQQQQRPLQCIGIHCQNNGTCVVEDAYARCDCPFGTAGSYCERSIDVRFPKFRGTGYLGLPVLRDGYKEFAVAVEFRPEAKNGLLLFSAEFQDARKDFFSIALVSGFIEFRFDCGTGAALLQSPEEVVMGQWNRLVVARNNNQGSLQLNSANVVEATAPGAYTRITLRQNLYVGGYPDMDTIESRVNTSKRFVGCVQELIINGYRYDFRRGGLVGDAEFGVNVGECSEGLCDNVVCQNGGTCHAKTADTSICLCPLGFHGSICEKETPVRIPRFNGHSHLEYAGLGRTVLAFTELEAVIKPEAADGMVLYNGYTLDRKGDFLALALRNGFVEFSFDLGTGPARIRSAMPLGLNQWHVIRASRTGLQGVLKVDEQPEVTGQSQGAYTQLTLLENLFIGGHHNFDHTSKHANLSTSFAGCIQKIVVNGRPLRILEEKVDGRNIEPCEHPCAGEPCMNGGECVAQEEVYKCNCPLGFTNTNCEDKLERMPTKPMFSGSSFLIYTHSDIAKRITGNRMDVQLYIRPKGRNGLLLWSGQDVMTTNSDFVALGFVDGSLQLHYNLGSGKALIAYNDSRLFDGQWHFIRVQRDNRDAYMEVDSREIVEGSSPGSYTMLNTNRILYLGGMPNVAEGTDNLFTTNYVGCVKDLLLATDFNVQLIEHAQSGRNVLQCRKHL